MSLCELALKAMNEKATDVERHLYLVALSQCNVDLFYKVVINHVEQITPLLYTPFVGHVCLNFSHLFPYAKSDGRGLFISIHDKGNISAILRTIKRDVKAIVVTDGQRILGLGDQGANGMGIPIGKLALYTALAGVHPQSTLPITLDVGTDNKKLIVDPCYIGNRHSRIIGAEYDEFLEEFMVSADELFDHPLIQFEDFGNKTAFDLLHRYEKRMCVFNDDIQGTSAIILAGILSSLKITGKQLADQRFLFFGAGEAGAGIAELLALAISLSNGGSNDKSNMEIARKHCWLIDRAGLITIDAMPNLASHKKPFAHSGIAPMTDLLQIIRIIRPTALFGVSSMKSAFTQDVIELMSEINFRPIIFALSNPTDKAECTAEQAFTWSKGNAIFASGSPFPNVTINGKTLIAGQGNNSYIFPGIGLGLVWSRSYHCNIAMFLAAAKVVAELVTQEDLDHSLVYPPLCKIRDVSLNIAVAVAKIVRQNNWQRISMFPQTDTELRNVIEEFQYNPKQYQVKL
jgi:malate dehydrogenase (oxaloacetate-decarboxylating)(NADP+)